VILVRNCAVKINNLEIHVSDILMRLRFFAVKVKVLRWMMCLQ